jgi:DNA-binding transcriptional regulator LsrR (DeoR family)
VDIAAALGVSRFRVARLLQQCVRDGIVRIAITPPGETHTEIESLLRDRYDLEHVVVVGPNAAEPERDLRAQLGHAAADLLMRIATARDVIGVGWGRTIKAMTEAVTALPPCPIVQLGGMTGNPGENSMELVRRLAAVSRGHAYPLYAPLIVGDEGTAEGLRRQPGIADTMRRYDDVTIGVIAVGSWDPPNSQLRIAVSTEERRRLTALGVRAEVCAVLLDANGQTLAGDVTRRTLAIGADQLRRIPAVIAVAGGLSKAHAIHSVLIGRYATSLVTDIGVARQLLEQPQRSPIFGASTETS